MNSCSPGGKIQWPWRPPELKVSEQENSEAPVSEPKEDEKTKKD